MKMDFITFRSITPAQRGQRLLRQEGIDAILMRTPRRMEQKGCGYCLRVKSADRDRAVDLLRQENVPFNKVYTSQNGQEVAL